MELTYLLLVSTLTIVVSRGQEHSPSRVLDDTGYVQTLRCYDNTNLSGKSVSFTTYEPALKKVNFDNK